MLFVPMAIARRISAPVPTKATEFDAAAAKLAAWNAEPLIPIEADADDTAAFTADATALNPTEDSPAIGWRTKTSLALSVKFSPLDAKPTCHPTVPSTPEKPNDDEADTGVE